jgi:hypothetical protein
MLRMIYLQPPTVSLWNPDDQPGTLERLDRQEGFQLGMYSSWKSSIMQSESLIFSQITITIFQQGIYQDERQCISKSVPVMPLSRWSCRAMLPRPQMPPGVALDGQTCLPKGIARGVMKVYNASSFIQDCVYGWSRALCQQCGSS